jgi:gas vesicle protein
MIDVIAIRNALNYFNLRNQTITNMSTGKALLGVMAGIAAGAVLGMLFAPEKGSNTRKSISKKGDDLASALSDKVDEKFNELMGSVTGKMKKSPKSEASASSGMVD